MNDQQQPIPPSDSDPQLLGDAALSGLDAAAMDALLAAGFDLERVAAPMRPRAERLAGVLGLLEVRDHAADVEVMVDAVLARVRLIERRSAASISANNLALSGNDDDALESLIAAGYSAEAVPSVMRRRAHRQASLLAMLEPANAEVATRGDLISRTLARVQASIDQREKQMVIAPAPELGRAGRRFGLRELVTVAAMVLIGTAAVGPMVGAFREQSRKMACQSNLQAAGIGFGSYAGEFRDALPMAASVRPGTTWWSVGNPEQSNSAHLFTLARTGYVKLDELACPGNPQACRTAPAPQARDWRTLGEVSYSYQNMFGGEQPLLRGTPGTTHLIIAVDGSPVVRRAIRGQWINPLANSMNHGGSGQNALYNDGHVEWLSSPVLPSGEHIWLPHAIERRIAVRNQPTQAEPIKGIETPNSADDVFVGP